MKKKRKYKSPYIIVMDYEMEELCLDNASAIGPDEEIYEEPEIAKQRNYIPIIDTDFENDF